jgi:CTP:molybdopterin cytidylyltransferase MocA
VAALRAADPVAAVAVALDAGGAVQPLLAAHRVPALLARLAAGGDVAGRPARWLLGADPVPVPVPPGAADDVDTPEQLAAARERAARG